MEPNEVRTRLVEDEQQDDEQSVEGHSMRLNLTDEAGPDGMKKVSRVDDADDEFDTEGHIRQL
jgi:hypothetical protein